MRVYAVPMTEAKVPGYFETKRDQWNEPNSDLLPFDYDANGQEFKVGETALELAEFDPYKSSPDVEEDGAGSIPIDKMHEHPLMIPTMSGVIGGPKLHEWATANSELVAKEATEVMHRAFVSLIDEEFASEVKNVSAGFMGFDAGARENGGVVLQVFGNCACLGVSQDGLFVYDGMENGYGQYELHNADSQAQRASLYAGIGHLARLAS